MHRHAPFSQRHHGLDIITGYRFLTKKMRENLRRAIAISSRSTPFSLPGKSTKMPLISKRQMRTSSHNFANDPPNPKASTLAAVSKWIKTCWDSDRNLPAFAVDGNKISVLLQPQEFYQTLKVVMVAFLCTVEVRCREAYI